ncbi:Alpha/Beta hydrolase protein [Microdochium trichocladiopsis]|uniref:Alpha/Beta hydrolase protein n=1 Tax=Microdochium trichocladiopsis TaxID=1682393 RepID=A0A9P8Y340_9PEZI|nr:Alpha/Beta hydrolase protein [Microdochium trichocladiopsis]KAH7027599.1 Alpha/Beta hydrolase protein [Microdochium trichocladiopsis]
MLAPVVFAGLFVALWTWKCCMLVLFQNKIIFMPGMPPNSRWETIADYSARCAGIKWREERVRAADGTDLALCVADVSLGSLAASNRPPTTHFYILYFQGKSSVSAMAPAGNAASTPPRLPDLSSTLSMLKKQLQQDALNARCTMVCLSYRGYWTSRGRPNENGIRLDATAALNWTSAYHAGSAGAGCKGHAVYWGQSVGSGVATNLAAEVDVPSNLRLDNLILETPFTSIRAMLSVLYPQKWLPYQYLWPFLRTHLDSYANIAAIAERYRNTEYQPQVLILEAAKDELVPSELSQQILERCQEVGLEVSREKVNGAFHNDVIFRAEGRRTVSGYLARRLAAVQHNSLGK